MTQTNANSIAQPDPSGSGIPKKTCKCLNKSGKHCTRDAISDVTEHHVEQRDIQALMEYCPPCWYGVCDEDGLTHSAA